jgi:hypothetical protein
MSVTVTDRASARERNVQQILFMNTSMVARARDAVPRPVTTRAGNGSHLMQEDGTVLQPAGFDTTTQPQQHMSDLGAYSSRGRALSW